MSRASAAARWSDEESEDESQRVMAPAASHRTCKGPVPSHGSVAAAESYAAADSDSSKYSVLIFLNVFPDVMTSKERRVKTVVGKLGLNESMWKVNFADAQVVDFVALVHTLWTLLINFWLRFTCCGLCSLFYHLGSHVVDFGSYFSHCYFFF